MSMWMQASPSSQRFPVRLTSSPRFVPSPALVRALESVALVDANTAGAVGFATQKARRFLRKYFGDSAELQLPSTLLHWATNACTLRNGIPPARIVQQENGQLVVRVTGCADNTLQLILDEQNDLTDYKRLRALGLTPRETEVLFWIMRGKTSRETSIILGCAMATVAKHTEHILAKLQVETRTAAAAIALRATS